MTPYDTLTHWLNIFEAYRSKSFIDELLRIIQAWFANIKLRQMYILTWPAKAKRSVKNNVFQAQSSRSDHSVMGRFARFATNLPQLTDRFSVNLTLTVIRKNALNIDKYLCALTFMVWFFGSGGGTWTPDTRIMIKLLQIFLLNFSDL